MQNGQWWITVRGTLVCVSDSTQRTDLAVLVQRNGDKGPVQLPNVPSFITQE